MFLRFQVPKSQNPWKNRAPRAPERLTKPRFRLYDKAKMKTRGGGGAAVGGVPGDASVASPTAQ